MTAGPKPLADAARDTGRKLYEALELVATGHVKVACLVARFVDAEGGAWGLEKEGRWRAMPGHGIFGHRPSRSGVAHKVPKGFDFVFVDLLRHGDDFRSLTDPARRVRAVGFTAIVTGPILCDEEEWTAITALVRGEGLELALGDLYVMPEDLPKLRRLELASPDDAEAPHPTKWRSTMRATDRIIAGLVAMVRADAGADGPPAVVELARRIRELVPTEDRDEKSIAKIIGEAMKRDREAGDR